MIKWLKESIKRNHFAQMAICCALPVIFILGAQLLGFNGWWIYPVALAVCIGSHLVISYAGLKEGKSCH